jgi:hypothetical protein
MVGGGSVSVTGGAVVGGGSVGAEVSVGGSCVSAGATSVFVGGMAVSAGASVGVIPGAQAAKAKINNRNMVREIHFFILLLLSLRGTSKSPFCMRGFNLAGTYSCQPCISGYLSFLHRFTIACRLLSPICHHGSQRLEGYGILIVNSLR